MTFMHVFGDNLVKDRCFKGVEVGIARLLRLRLLESFSFCVEWSICIVPEYRFDGPLFALIS